MPKLSQRNAVRQYRQRAAVRGIKRIEVQAAEEDRLLLTAIAAALRGDEAALVRTAMLAVLKPAEAKPALDLFASDLPDEAFDGIFSRPDGADWRETGL